MRPRTQRHRRAAPALDQVHLEDQRAAGTVAEASRQDGWGRNQFGYDPWVQHDDGHAYQVAGCPDAQVTVAITTYRLHRDRDQPIGIHATADTSRTLHQAAQAAWRAQINQPK